MGVADIRARVASEAHARLMPVLLDRMALHHRKGWRDCDCEWCLTKQIATADIALSPVLGMGREAREERRARLRVVYRARLARAFAQ